MRPLLMASSTIFSSASFHSCLHIHPSSSVPSIDLDSMASLGDGAAAAAVCCMCGDHGLPRELFRCSLCRLRLQHRYCSDLYPGPASYRTCNWCLKEEGGGGDSSPVKARTAAAVAKRGLNNSRDDDSGDKDSPCGGCNRAAFSADPGKLVKKPKKGDERAVQRPVATTAAKGRRKEQAGAGRKARVRVKVRRYKLLAEVIC